MAKRRIRVIDETIREGMQFHGMVFTLEQRKKLLAFQERLGVAVSQIGYPPALPREADLVSELARFTKKKKYRLRTAALGRSTPSDADILINTRVDDPHFHIYLPSRATAPPLIEALNHACALMGNVVSRRPGARISLALVNMAGIDPFTLDTCLIQSDKCPALAILSLPDTSGELAPNQVFDTIKAASIHAGHLKLSAHCHNDMGMASANSYMAVIAGAQLLEASVFGIGERNGIADLYTTASLLEKQGIDTGLNLSDMEGFKAYYTCVRDMVKEQTGIELIDYRCPVFGDAVKTHVAGTHARGKFGFAREETFFLNLLCGKTLVEKYLTAHSLPFDPSRIGAITGEIKQQSFDRGRALTTAEIQGIASDSRGTK